MPAGRGCLSMGDIVVTVPKTFTHPAAPGKRGLAAWIGEGDAAPDPWSGEVWGFTVWGGRPPIVPGERVYIVCEGKLRGYSPLVGLDFDHGPQGCEDVATATYGQWILLRGGDAVAVTIADPIRGFRGWRKRWWVRDEEIPFPNWKTA